MFKKTSLLSKMLLGIIPAVALALILVTAVSVSRSSNAIEDLTAQKAEESILANVSDINATLMTLRSTATTLANTVGGTYSSTDLDVYQAIFKKTVLSSDIISGSGIWFKKGVYEHRTYAGPYWLFLFVRSKTRKLSETNMVLFWWITGTLSIVSGMTANPIGRKR
jgi:methyl-accepting chemotaxis protein